MYSGVIFDLGNTLVESSSLARTLSAVLDSERSPDIGREIEKTIEVLYRTNQQEQPDWRDVWRDAFETHQEKFTEDVALAHLRVFVAQGKTYPYTVPVLSALKRSNLKLALLSNTTGPPSVFDQDLSNRRLKDYFTTVIWSSEIGYRKPSKRAFQITLDKLELSEKDVLMVGDSELADIHGAKTFGIDTLLITEKQVPGESEANYTVTRKDVLTKILAITSKSSGPAKAGVLT